MVELIYKGTGAVKKQVISYLHTDHLNTPRLATNDAQTTVWRWESIAFGAGKAELNPDGDKQKVVINLRFPGQYYDSESGLHYNYYRDYDPRTGRYIQSDPIGLKGGLNTYAYVGANPLRYIDSFGLICVECIAGNPGGKSGKNYANGNKLCEYSCTDENGVTIGNSQELPAGDICHGYEVNTKVVTSI